MNAATLIGLALMLLPVTGRGSIPGAPPAQVGPAVSPVSVGREGRLEAVLPGAPIEVKPLDKRAEIVVRIAGTRPHGTATRYDLRYFGLVPGRYDLRQSLVRRDGTTLEDVPPLAVEIVGRLPAEHHGWLIEEPLQPIALFGTYRTLMISLAAAWLVAPLVWFLVNRRRTKTRATKLPDAPPTLADRLRPLVEQAAAGALSHDGQAQLERLLILHWRQRLGLETRDPADALAVLRQHPEAGALLRALEDWLHRPPGASASDVNALLAPYRNVPAAESAVSTFAVNR